MAAVLFFSLACCFSLNVLACTLQNEMKPTTQLFVTCELWTVPFTSGSPAIFGWAQVKLFLNTPAWSCGLTSNSRGKENFVRTGGWTMSETKQGINQTKRRQTMQGMRATAAPPHRSSHHWGGGGGSTERFARARRQRSIACGVRPHSRRLRMSWLNRMIESRFIYCCSKSVFENLNLFVSISWCHRRVFVTRSSAMLNSGMSTTEFHSVSHHLQKAKNT